MPYYRCTACGVTTYSAAAYSSAGVCPSCSARLTEDSKVDVRPGTADDVTRVLTMSPEAPSEARREIVALPIAEAHRERLALLVSELVTNSLRHAGLAPDEEITLRITNREGAVRVAIRDGGQGFARAPVRREPAALDGTGNGLLIVDEIADDWGAERDADGFTVWCEVASG